MDTSDYSEKIFNMHFKHFSSTNPKNGFTMLELGPGDSVLSALFGYLNGAEAIYLLDVGSFASADIDLYRDAYDRWCIYVYDGVCPCTYTMVYILMRI